MQSWPDRGQTEPLAALVAVFALGAGLSLYVGALDSTLPFLTTESEITPTAADRLVSEASSSGAVRPPIAGATETARPDGHAMNATVRTEAGSWYGGAPTPESANCVRRGVAVRVAPGTVRPGSLEVCTWPEP